MNLGQRLKKLRLQKGLSAKELSDLSGVTRSLISELETGKRESTSVDTIARLAQALQTSPAYFFDNEKFASLKVTYSVSEDVRDFLLREDSQPYLRLAQKAQELGMEPELLDELLDILTRFRTVTRDKGPGDLSPYHRKRPKN